MSSNLHQLLLVPALAGALAGAALLGTHGTAAADNGAVSLAVACRSGECTSNDPNGETSSGPGGLQYRSNGGSPAWQRYPGGPRARLAYYDTAPSQTAAAAAARQQMGVQDAAQPGRMSSSSPRRNAGGDGPYRARRAYGGAVCQTGGPIGAVITQTCDNDVNNNLIVRVSQWGHGNQVNIAVFFQNISQLAASGTGNAANTAADNPISAGVGQSNEHH